MRAEAAKSRRIGPAGKKFLLDAQLKSISLIHIALLGGAVTRFYSFSRNLDEEERKFFYINQCFFQENWVYLFYTESWDACQNLPFSCTSVFLSLDVKAKSHCLSFYVESNT